MSAKEKGRPASDAGLSKQRVTAEAVRIADREGVEGFIMHATPCTFLNKANLCGIYKDRPEHCRAFPDTVRDWCPLSRVIFADLLPVDRRPAPLGPEPKRRVPRVRKRLTLAAATEPDA